MERNIVEEDETDSNETISSRKRKARSDRPGKEK